MSLLSLSYAALVLCAVALCSVFPQRFRSTLLSILSLLFYAWGSVEHAALILGLGVFVFLLGERLFSHPKRNLLGLGISLCVVVLVYFKYSVLFLQTLANLLPSKTASWAVKDRADSLALTVQIPLGISFFTFEFVHYLTDIYLGKITRPNPASTWRKRVSEFFLFALFFPTLLAGPIKRFQQFIPIPPSPHQQVWTEALSRILVGLCKKILIADSLATIALRLRTPELTTQPGLWFAMYAYAGQIYADFSGYSDVAIGISLLLGYRIAENFNYPYFASNLQDFWRRWHISLSSWIRDYLFIPLGGSHVPKARAFFNLLVVMALCGLWHGAAGHFVVWGIWHGLGLGIERLVRRNKTQGVVFFRFLGWFWTFHFVCFGWILFATPSLKSAAWAFQKMFGLKILGMP